MEESTVGLIVADRVIQKLRPWLITITSLLGLFTVLVTILVLSVIFNPSSDEKPGQTSTQQQSLPKGLSRPDQREELFDSFVKVYNARNYQALTEYTSPAYRMQTTETEFKKGIDRIYGMAAHINDGVYDHFEMTSGNGGLNSYTLFYRIVFDSTSKGVLTIGVTQQGSDPYVPSGFKVCAD